MKKLSRIFALVFCFVLLVAIPVSAAAAPYETYTYTIDGEAALSPHAYTPQTAIDAYSMNMALPLNGAQDIFVQEDTGVIYISDTGNNRVIVYTPDFVYDFEITTFYNEHGNPDALKGPEGLFVSDDTIYVCDTQNSRIVLFDLEGNFKSVVGAPTADVMGSDTVFRPVSVAVAPSGTMYIVSSTTYSGIIALNPDGSFQGFLGAQTQTVSLAVRIRRMIFPNVVTESYISTPYQSLTLDNEGIIWATIVFDAEGEEQLSNDILAGTVESDYAPVKRLNAKGDDIMVRNGFVMPAGEVVFNTMGDMAAENGPSSLVDIAMGPNGMWSVLDAKRSKIYTYDSEGNMLFAFGDKGKQLGNLSTPTAISYNGSDIYVLDSTLNSVTVFKRTDYGDVIDQALMHNANREYSVAYDDWQDILRRNINFDAAYVGIGRNLYRQGQYEEAMDFYKDASEQTNYSIAFKAWRKDWVERNIFWVLLVVVVVIVLLAKAFGYIGKKNKAGETKVGKRTLWEEFLYGFYIIFHPFDGFWDLKHEKRGSVRGALCIDALAVVSVAYQMMGSAYLFGGGQKMNIVVPVVTVLGPLMLWCVANWCLTTLFDGEGNFKDIFVASSYALVPLPLLGIPATIATNFFSLDEAQFVTLLLGLSYVWMAMLIVFGSATTHGYSMGRNIVITIFTIVGMVFILFVMLLFTNLIQRMLTTVTDIITEVSYRLE
ncbi:MAG: YIP1 family protein [Clostridia bacterium]|nr:YIP1 family protein [Clostridia bacterium]